MHNMGAQLLMFTKMVSSPRFVLAIYIVLKKAKCFSSDNKYVCNETYIDKPRMARLNKF